MDKELLLTHLPTLWKPDSLCSFNQSRICMLAPSLIHIRYTTIRTRMRTRYLEPHVYIPHAPYSYGFYTCNTTTLHRKRGESVSLLQGSEPRNRNRA
jgi:hypothetical protein